MGEDFIPDHSLGRITYPISGELSEKALNFVYKQLSIWRDDSDRPREHSENRLNLSLCKFLDSTAREVLPMVRFDHEEYQEGHRSVDLSASPSEAMLIGAKGYTIYEPFLVIEGKRLPAPAKGREKEYVTGLSETSGGIQRFKMGVHGGKQDVAVMIGYVQENDVNTFRKAVDKWVGELADGTINDGCSWDKSEILKDFKKDVPRRTSRSRSVHSRTGNCSTDQIVLHHLWVEMN